MPEAFGSDAQARCQFRSLRAVGISSVLRSMSIDCSTWDRHLGIVVRLCAADMHSPYVVLNISYLHRSGFSRITLSMLGLPISCLELRKSCDVILIDKLVFKVPNIAV